MSTHDVTRASNPWRRFWERGGWWRALLLLVAYLVVYNGVGLLLGLAFRGLFVGDDPLGSVENVLFGLALPIILGGALPLVLFLWSVGWLRGMFARQPIRGRAWMWVAVALVLVPIVLRVAGIDWSAYSAGVIASTLFAGVAIGFAEELLTRGVAVDLLRRHGYGERAVAVLSSLLFALLHSSNLLAGQPVVTVLLTMAYTFGFGMMMYLVLRVTGHIIWPMILHALTDPTTMLVTGGIDGHGDTAGSEGLIGLAGTFNFIYPVLGLIVILFISGRVHERRSANVDGLAR